jgi:hypothetical protein
MERSEIRGGIDASRQSRITLRSIGATCLKDRVKIASLRIFAVVIDFRFRPPRVSAPSRSNVSLRKAAISMTYKDAESPIQRRHLTTVAASD